MTLSELAGRELRWVQPRALKRQYELRSGDQRLATLTRRSLFGSFATGESREGCWTFKRMGFFRTRVTIRRCDSDVDIALFRNATWKGGGALEFPDGRRVLATTNFWQSRLEFKTERGELLFALKRQGVFRFSASLRMEPKAAPMPDLPWMVMLGWYLILMISEDAGATAAAAG